jgi:hypothetical protein
MGLQTDQLGTLKFYSPAVGRHGPRDAVKQGCLAGSIGPNQADDFPGIYLQGNIVKRRQTPEVFRYVANFQQCHI